MNLTLVEITQNEDKFLSIWLDNRLFKSDNEHSIYDWTKGFESGLEYAGSTYEKNFLSYEAENDNEAYKDLCEVSRRTQLDEYLRQIDNAGLNKIEENL